MTDVHKQRLQILRDQFSSLSLAAAKATISRTRLLFYEFGNKPSRALARSLRQQRARSFISEIKAKGGKRAITDKDIANTFRQLYKDLYNIAPKLTTEEEGHIQAKIQKYLADLGLPRLSGEQATALEAPITQEEFMEAVKTSSTGKAPGPDGLLSSYYKTFGSELVTHFLKAFNSTSESGVLSSELLKAFISTIPKEGKDKLLCQSYRPIALLNVDAKLFAKILARGMDPLLTELIHPDVRF